MVMKAGPLRKDIKSIIDDQPLIVHRYILLAGDGVTTGNSWSWAGSWRGRRDTMGRSVWYTQRNELGEAGQRMYTLLLPWTANNREIEVGQRVELYSLAGTSEGEYILTWVDINRDSYGNIWKVECSIEEYQG